MIEKIASNTKQTRSFTRDVNTSTSLTKSMSNHKKLNSSISTNRFSWRRKSLSFRSSLSRMIRFSISSSRIMMLFFFQNSNLSFRATTSHSWRNFAFFSMIFFSSRFRRFSFSSSSRTRINSFFNRLMLRSSNVIDNDNAKFNNTFVNFEKRAITFEKNARIVISRHNRQIITCFVAFNCRVRLSKTIVWSKRRECDLVKSWFRTTNASRVLCHKHDAIDEWKKRKQKTSTIINARSKNNIAIIKTWWWKCWSFWFIWIRFFEIKCNNVCLRDLFEMTWFDIEKKKKNDLKIYRILFELSKKLQLHQFQ